MWVHWWLCYTILGHCWLSVSRNSILDWLEWSKDFTHRNHIHAVSTQPSSDLTRPGGVLTRSGCLGGWREEIEQSLLENFAQLPCQVRRRCYVGKLPILLDRHTRLTGEMYRDNGEANISIVSLYREIRDARWYTGNWSHTYYYINYGHSCYHVQ